MTCGIYKIENMYNNKVYIGQSNNIKDRWRRHRNSMKLSELPLYKSMRKYGIDTFKFEILEECSIDALNEREIFYIDYYSSYLREYGYNLSMGGHIGVFCKLDYEEVSEIIDLLRDSSMQINEIAKKFNVHGNTITAINNGRNRVRDIDYPIRSLVTCTPTCQNCGSKISSTKTKLCLSCYKKSHICQKIPPKDVLLVEAKLFPFCKLSEKYNVSRTTIKRWCILYNIYDDIKLFRVKSKKEPKRKVIRDIIIAQYGNCDPMQFNGLEDCVDFFQKLKPNFVRYRIKAHIMRVINGERTTYGGYSIKIK